MIRVTTAAASGATCGMVDPRRPTTAYRSPLTDCPPARPPRGFTLIEMLVVFLVIAVLIGILVPVISGAYQRSKEAAELAEINSIVNALITFKDDHGGSYPPSQFVLIEDGNYSAANWNRIFGNGEVGESPNKDGVFVRSVSVQYIRKFWPQFPINDQIDSGVDYNGDGSVTAADWVDWNGDGNPTGGSVPHVFLLTADECLVFFLGGIPTGQYIDGAMNGPNRPSNVQFNPKTFPPGTSGFSRNPQRPMLAPTAGTSSTSRAGPYHEFDSSRLVDRDQDGFWEFVPLRRPPNGAAYAYFSAYDGVGYRPDDLNLAREPSGDITNPNPPSSNLYFRVLWSVPSAYPGNYIGNESGATVQTSVHSPGPNPYTIGPPFLPGNYSTSPISIPPVRYYKPDSFQLISPGLDAAYGQGGAIPRLGSSSFTSSPFSYFETKEDNDNLTSFAKGELKNAGE